MFYGVKNGGETPFYPAHAIVPNTQKQKLNVESGTHGLDDA